MTRSQRIPMAGLGALTFHSSRSTTGRRTDPIPQLSCKGRPCRSFQPSSVQCVPMGSDGVGGLEWKCEADLPKNYAFGPVEVSCEGWDGPSDPYILKGSCALNYELVKSSNAFEDSKDYLASSYSSDSFSWTNLFTALLFLYALYILFTSLFPRLWSRFPGVPRTLGGAPRPPGGGGGGGGWGGGFWPGGGGRGNGGPRGPPPPYTPKPSEPTPEAWRPGFWTGAATAAAAMQGLNYMRQPAAPAYGGGRFGGMGMGGARRFDDDDTGVGGSGTRWGGGGGSGGSGASSSMRPSTGFGGTRNR